MDQAICLRKSCKYNFVFLCCLSKIYNWINGNLYQKQYRQGFSENKIKD